ncbi:MAG: hypothetical protein U0520_02120 [Candidatus Saccharimonadales bacterium]
MGLFRRRHAIESGGIVSDGRSPQQIERDLLDARARSGEFEHLEGTKDWAGLWELHRQDMTWWRPEHYYFRSAVDGAVHQNKLLHRGPMVRPPQMEGINHIDVPLAVIRSHPDTPNALSEWGEGRWLETNPAWPEKSVDHALGKLGVQAVWAEASADQTETLEIVPGLVDDVRIIECQPFDSEPFVLNAVLVYVRPAEVMA